MGKTLTFFAMLILVFVNIFSANAQDGVVVTEVRVAFFVPARSADKDVNTQITTTLYTGMGKRVAMLDHCCGNIHFPDANYTTSSYQLELRNTISKSEIQNGYFDSHIDPTTAGKWIFMPTFQISFSDGSKVVIKGEDDATPYTKRIVSQEAPDTSFPFHL